MTSNPLIKTVLGVDIYFDGEKFLARVNGKILRRASVRDMERAIEEKVALPTGEPVQAILIGGTHYEPAVVTVVGYDKRSKRFRLSSGALADTYADLYHYDAFWEGELRRISQEMERLSDERRQAIARLRKLHPTDLLTR